MKSELKNQILLIPILFILSALLPVFAWMGCFNFDEDVASWFQRSGSLMVLCAGILEYILFNITLSSTPQSGKKKQLYVSVVKRYVVSPRYLRFIHTLKYIAAFIAIVGTVIWGYGDLIYISIHEV